MKISINFTKQFLIFWIVLSLMFPVLLKAQDEWDDEWEQENSNENNVAAGIKNKKKEKWLSFKGEAVIDAPIDVVSYFFKDIEKSVKFTPGIKEKRIFEVISDTERIEYTYTRLPWPFKDRYTIYSFKEAYNNGNEVLLTMNSVKDYPFKDKNKILGTIKESHFLLRSLEADESKTHVAIDMHIDFGGWLPLWLVKPHTKKWADKLLKNLGKNIRQYREKQASLK